MTDNDWIHPVEVGEIFGSYDLDSETEDTHELLGKWVVFSYHNRSADSIVDRTGTITDLGGRNNGVYWIQVEADSTDTIYHIDDIGVVRSPARSRAHLGPLTAFEIRDSRES